MTWGRGSRPLAPPHGAAWALDECGFGEGPAVTLRSDVRMKLCRRTAASRHLSTHRGLPGTMIAPGPSPPGRAFGTYCSADGRLAPFRHPPRHAADGGALVVQFRKSCRPEARNGQRAVRLGGPATRQRRGARRRLIASAALQPQQEGMRRDEVGAMPLNSRERRPTLGPSLIGVSKRLAPDSRSFRRSKCDLSDFIADMFGPTRISEVRDISQRICNMGAARAGRMRLMLGLRRMVGTLCARALDSQISPAGGHQRRFLFRRRQQNARRPALGGP